MNLVIIKQDELTEDGHVYLADRRAQHIVSVLRGVPGQTVRIGILNGAVGTGIIEETTKTQVRLNCTFSEVPRAAATIDLILALPRPKVMKRLLAPLASLGVHRLFLTNAAKVERNYFDTHWLSSEHVESLLIEGLEQAGDTQLPQVTVVRRLKPFIEDRVHELFPSGTRILAHPSREQEARDIPLCSAPVVLALGPEGGWTPFETDLFDKHGFLRMSLGPRTLRTDIACIALISVLRHLL